MDVPQPICELCSSVLAHTVVVVYGGVVVAVVESGLEGAHVARGSECLAIHPTHPTVADAQKTLAEERRRSKLFSKLS